MKIYLVGGAVRDKLLQLPITDRDWVVVGGTKEILLKSKFQQVGKDFPVFLHPKTHEEYSLARRERKSGVGYTGFKFIFDKNVTLKEDLIRRDLTINAIAQDKKGNYIDPFQGKKDLKNCLLRHVSHSFVEDPLRVLRTARLAASLMHLGFQIVPETMMLMISMVKNKELLHLTSNRIWIETEKALKTLNPHVYFQVLHACHALYYIFPEISFLFEEKNFFSLNFFKNLYNNSILFMRLSKISILTEDIAVRFSYLCQFLCKDSIFFSIKKFYDKSAACLVKNLCNRLNIPSHIREIATLSAGFYIFLKNIYYQSSQDIVNFFLKIDAWRKPDRIDKLSLLTNFNYFYEKKNNSKKYFFLKKSFESIKNISIKLILSQGFKGLEIKNELNRIRVQKLQSWRKKIHVI